MTPATYIGNNVLSGIVLTGGPWDSQEDFEKAILREIRNDDLPCPYCGCKEEPAASFPGGWPECPQCHAV
jgi:hypothetical protein